MKLCRAPNADDKENQIPQSKPAEKLLIKKQSPIELLRKQIINAARTSNELGQIISAEFWDKVMIEWGKLGVGEKEALRVHSEITGDLAKQNRT